MISLKSPREIELMAEAGKIVARVHKKMSEIVRPGISTLEIDAIAEEVIRANGATPSFKGYEGFPCATCTSVNDILVHGIPNHNVLKNGDIISIDVGACYKGYHGDSAWTYVVGEVKDEKVLDLLKVTEEALYEGLKMAQPGNRIGDISHAIQTYVESHGYSTPVEYTGHGIGRTVHEEPYVPNVGQPHRGELLKPGMCIAIEPMVFMGKAICRTLPDGWGVYAKDHSLAAHYEHSIAILDNGYKILTKED